MQFILSCVIVSEYSLEFIIYSFFRRSNCDWFQKAPAQIVHFGNDRICGTIPSHFILIFN